MENKNNLNWVNVSVPPEGNWKNGKWQSYKPTSDSYYASLMSDLDKIDNVSELDEEQVLRIKEKFKEVENSLKEKIKPKTITISGPTHNKIKEHCTITMENIGDWSEKILLSATKNLSNERILLDALKTYKEKVLRGPNNIEGFMGKDKLVNRINMDIEYYTYQTGLYFQLGKCAPSECILNAIKNIPNSTVSRMPIDDADVLYSPKITEGLNNKNNPDYFTDAIINHMNKNNLDIAISVQSSNDEKGKYRDDITKAFKDSLGFDFDMEMKFTPDGKIRNNDQDKHKGQWGEPGIPGTKNNSEAFLSERLKKTPINVVPEKLVIDEDINTSTNNWDGYEKEMSNTTRELLIKHEEKVLREEFEKHMADEKEKAFQTYLFHKQTEEKLKNSK
jgi:hypothetical protein